MWIFIVGLLVAIGPALSGARAQPAAVTAEPPLPYASAVAARFPAPPAVYRTPGLLPERRRWTDNAELAAALRTLAGAGAAILLDLGRTEAGGELLALRFSRGAGRPVALLVGQQHGNEPAGGEALLALAMQLANPGHPLSAVLDRLDVLLWPRINPDGAALDRRGNATGLDINRDHLLLQTREAEALARLVASTQPLLFVDLHEHLALGRSMPAFGVIKSHDMLIQYATTANLPPALTALAEQDFRQPLLRALDAAGISHDWYYTNRRDPQELLLSMGGVQPGLARNAGGLKNMVSVLLESRGFDLGRLHAQRRVHSQLVALDSLLHSAALLAGPLQRQLQDIGGGVAALACGGTLVLEAAPTRRRREITLIDPVTGADKPLVVDWDDALQLQPLATRPRPCGYWLAGDAGAAVSRLHTLGVTVRTLPAAARLRVERYHETARAEGERGEPPGRVGLQRPLQRITVALEPKWLDAAPGSFYVSLDQPLAHLITAALEPDTAHSWYAHHLLPRLDAVQRVLAPP